MNVMLKCRRKGKYNYFLSTSPLYLACPLVLFPIETQDKYSVVKAQSPALLSPKEPVGKNLYIPHIL